MDTALQSLVERVEVAAAARTPLCIRGSGSKDFYGNTPQGQVLDVRGWQGIEVYDPSELVITARAGTPLAELEATLAEQGQMLAFEPPHFGPGATVGGCVAAGLAGPRRASAGPTQGGLRDFVLGARLLDGRGRQLRFGGTVIKNVAGYDVSRLLAGSLGILGVILEVSLKVLPLARAELTVQQHCDETTALLRCNQWGGQPLPLSATHWQDGVLSVRLAGAEAAVREAAVLIGGQALAAGAAQTFWTAEREHVTDFFAGDAPLWRFALPSTAPPLTLEGMQCIEWGGAQRWLRSTQSAETLRARAAALGGHATLFRGGDRTAGVFTPLSPAVLAVHRGLKTEFDPAGIFNVGRLVQGL
jgi:glycolate oxidase FAD binding subunit